MSNSSHKIYRLLIKCSNPDALLHHCLIFLKNSLILFGQEKTSKSCFEMLAGNHTSI